MRRCPGSSLSSIARAMSRSAVPVAGPTRKSTKRPFLFSMSECADNDSLAVVPLLLRASFAWASVVERCVSFERLSPRKSTVGLPGSSGGADAGAPFFLKLLSDAHASIRVPSTVKCSWLKSRARRACSTTRAKKRLAMSASIRRCPVLRECTRIEPPLRHVHVQEPAKEKVVVELLAEETLAAHRVEGHQQRRLEQSFGRDGRPAHLRVHPIECNCEVRQCHIDELLDGAQRMPLGHYRRRRHQTDHGALLRLDPSHRATIRPRDPESMPRN